METLPYFPVSLQEKEEMPEFSVCLSVLSLCTHTEEMSSEDMGRRQLSENHRVLTRNQTSNTFSFFFFGCAGSSLLHVGFLFVACRFLIVVASLVVEHRF